MVVMDRQEYICMDNTNSLLAQPAYRPIPKDPTNKIKAKLITILRKVKKETDLGDSTYKYMYPIGCSAPKFYGLPKIYKPYIPLRPILSNRGSVKYGVGKVLIGKLKSLVSKSPTTSITHRHLLNRPKSSITARGMPQLIQCYSLVHLSSGRHSLGHNQGFIGTVQHPKGKDSITS